MTESIVIRETNETDRTWVNHLLQEHWGSTMIVSRGKSHDASKLPGFIATLDEQRVGLLTYHIDNHECEIVSLDSLAEGKGIG
jgi:hypothetical protein